MGKCILFNLNVLSSAADSQNLDNIVKSVRQQTDNQKTVKQIHGDTVRGAHVDATDLANTTVSGQDHDGGQVALKSTIEVSEALNVEHVNLIDEEHARHELGNTVVDVFVDDFVDFETELLSDLSLLGSVDLAHEGKEVTTTLGFGVSNIKIVKGHILDDFLLLVNVTLGDGHVLLGLQVELGSVRIATAYALDGT